MSRSLPGNHGCGKRKDMLLDDALIALVYAEHIKPDVCATEERFVVLEAKNLDDGDFEEDGDCEAPTKGKRISNPECKSVWKTKVGPEDGSQTAQDCL